MVRQGDVQVHKPATAAALEEGGAAATTIQQDAAIRSNRAGFRVVPCSSCGAHLRGGDLLQGGWTATAALLLVLCGALAPGCMGT